MDALLLTAGFGTRLSPLTSILPKCLMPIHGRPLLGLWLELLKRGGVDRVFINLHHHADLVEEYIENSPYKELINFLHEPKLLGTAGTINRLKSQFTSNDLCLIHADNLSLYDFKKFQTAYERRPQDCSLTMMTFDTDNPGNCGIVTLDSNKRVVNFIEKPKENIGSLANGAVYIIYLPEILKVIESDTNITDFSTQVLPHFIGHMNSFHNDHYHRDIGNIAALCAAQHEILKLNYANSLISAVDSYWQQWHPRPVTREKFLTALIKQSLPAATIDHLLQS